MIGQQLAAFFDLPIFYKKTMDVILQELKLPGDPLRFTNAFMPLKNIDDDTLLALVMAAVSGKTNPYELNSAVPLVDITGWAYRQVKGYDWREGIRFGEKELRLIRNPQIPTENWGQGLVAHALLTLDIRLNRMIELNAIATVLQGGYKVSANNITYQYKPGTVPNWFYLQLGADDFTSWVSLAFTDPPWIATPNNNRKWSDTTNSKPLTDIAEAIQMARESGVEVDSIWMTPKTARYLEQNAEFIAYVKANPVLALQAITIESAVSMLSGLKGLKVVVDERLYPDIAVGIANIASGDSTIQVDNIGPFRDGGQTITLVSEDMGTKVRVKTHATTDPAGNTVTLAATVGTAFTGKWRAIVMKPYLSDEYGSRGFVVLHGTMAGQVQYFASMPHALGPGGDLISPRPGIGSYRDLSPKSSEPWLEVGVSFSGVPVIFDQGGFLVMLVDY